ncbi:MAG: L,D-transpeptidase family protein [Oscillospiraceae bacterium]|nr:L,D-transpeptidase family protein [Oscillospiraceae bacterium]
MRKYIAILIALATVLCLFGCKPEPAPVTEPDPVVPPVVTDPEPVVTEPPTEPDPVLDTTKLYDIDVTNMTADEARATIIERIAAYQLSLRVNGEFINFSAEDLGMALSADRFQEWFDEALAGNNPDTVGLIEYDITAALSAIDALVTEDPVDATIMYNTASQSFSVKPDEDGIEAELAPAQNALISAISTLSPSHSVTVPTETVEAAIQADDAQLNDVVSDANEYLNLRITYSYNPKNIPAYTETISRETLATFISVSKHLEISFNTDAIQAYIATKSEDFSGSVKRGFTTSHGTVINLNVEYYDNVLDQKTMYEEILNCLKNKVTPFNGTAVFQTAEDSSMAYGGNYIEIDLNNQCLWLYKDGNLITSTPVTSGTVRYGYFTPTGVYSIQKKSTCVTLTGPTWASYVTYWMPFSGPYGLHDATWRTNFGGSTYLNDGSHGCVNLPFAQAEIIFNNISVGTKVIIYGGARSLDPVEQEFSGTSSYELTTADSTFKLNVKTKFTEPKLTYQSSNDQVVTVDNEGNVTIVGPGEATITVTSHAIGSVLEGTYTISIVVTGDPIETDPEETEPEETDPEETEPEQTEPEQTEPEQTEPETTDPETTAAQSPDPEN